jgi:hypothetical protein
MCCSKETWRTLEPKKKKKEKPKTRQDASLEVKIWPNLAINQI